jgi:protein O-mannose beta-1,4-N-acetylglucosaminyltransferase
MPGTLYADSFRSRIAELYGISYERKMITIYLRKEKRTIVNSVSFVRFVSTFAPAGYPVRVVDEFDSLSFVEQIKIMATSGMFISVHGAALTNIIFMPKSSVVLELAPFRFNYWLYHRIARNSALRYVRYTGSLDESMYKEPFRDAIRNLMDTPLTNRMCANQISDCMGFLRDVDLHVNISRFQPYFESALQLL